MCVYFICLCPETQKVKDVLFAVFEVIFSYLKRQDAIFLVHHNNNRLEQIDSPKLQVESVFYVRLCCWLRPYTSIFSFIFFPAILFSVISFSYMSGSAVHITLRCTEIGIFLRMIFYFIFL
jgi:hypothetical protein